MSNVSIGKGKNQGVEIRVEKPLKLTITASNRINSQIKIREYKRKSFATRQTTNGSSRGDSYLPKIARASTFHPKITHLPIQAPYA